jgi:hypothetical protein
MQMNKRTMIIILWALSILTMAYAIYRSTAEKVTTMENGQQIVYGEPQHGLVLGLCIFSGFCIMGSVALMLDRQEWRKEDAAALSKRTL